MTRSTKITAPTPRNGVVAGVEFTDGVGQTDDPNRVAFFVRRGWKVDGPKGDVPQGGSEGDGDPGDGGQVPGGLANVEAPPADHEGGNGRREGADINAERAEAADSDEEKPADQVKSDDKPRQRSRKS